MLHLVTLQVVWVFCRLLQLLLTPLPPMMEKVPQSQQCPCSQDEEEIHNEALLPPRRLNDWESDQRIERVDGKPECLMQAVPKVSEIP